MDKVDLVYWGIVLLFILIFGFDAVAIFFMIVGVFLIPIHIIKWLIGGKTK